MITSELPKELIEEILCRVPATSLKRLRSACKEWNHLFNDKKFSRKHFDKAAKQFLVLTLPEKSRVCLLNVNLHNGIPCVEVTVEHSLNQVNIDIVSHCDGLLLCTIKEDTRIVFWNPCTGQTEWIQTGEIHCITNFALGYCYQDNKSCDKRYKILSWDIFNSDFYICDIKSNSWRKLDVTLIPDFHFLTSGDCVYLKGKSYWFAYDSHCSLISFDYTSERFEHLSLPCQFDVHASISLSVVGEDKLSMLLQRQDTSRRELWVTKKIDDETKGMSWSKLLDVEVDIRHDQFHAIHFLVDEEKKIVMSCEQCYRQPQSDITVSIVREDSNATQRYLPVKKMSSCRTFLVDYVPSLIQF